MGCKNHQEPLISYLQKIAKSWIEPRFLFDACTEYLARNHIAIPKYTVLQRIISQVIKQERKRLSDTLKATISSDLAEKLADLVDGESTLTVKELKQAAKSFNVSELEKELNVNKLIQTWMNEVNQVVSALSLSQKTNCIMRRWLITTLLLSLNALTESRSSFIYFVTFRRGRKLILSVWPMDLSTTFENCVKSQSLCQGNGL